METLQDRILRLACKDGGIDLSKSSLKQDIYFNGPFNAQDEMPDPPASRMVILGGGDDIYPLDRTVYWNPVDITNLLDANDGWLPAAHPADGNDNRVEWSHVSKVLYSMVGLTWEDNGGDIMFADAPWRPSFDPVEGTEYTVSDYEPVFHGTLRIRGWRAPMFDGGEYIKSYKDSDSGGAYDPEDPSIAGITGDGDGKFSELFPGVVHPVLRPYRLKLADRRKTYVTSMSNIGGAADQLPLMDFVDSDYLGLDYTAGIRSMRTSGTNGISYFGFEGRLTGVERLDGATWTPADISEIYADVPAEMFEADGISGSSSGGDVFTLNVVYAAEKTSAGEHPTPMEFSLTANGAVGWAISVGSSPEDGLGFRFSTLMSVVTRDILDGDNPIIARLEVFTPGLVSDPAMTGTLLPCFRALAPARVIHRLIDPVYFPYDTIRPGEVYNIAELMQRPQDSLESVNSAGTYGLFFETMQPRHYEGTMDDPDSLYQHKKYLTFKNLNRPGVGTILFRIVEEGTGNHVGYYPVTSSNDY